ncbi:hypothetical protein N7461_006985 [Penicillium sp. DV-2018c]|nr:hypothetical protein N7461_006985 [Penicillium sp. DV-2018c]
MADAPSDRSERANRLLRRNQRSVAPKPYTPRNPAAFKRLSQQYDGLELIAQLERDKLASSASKWTFQHLLAFRLLVSPERAFLPILKDLHKDSCVACNHQTTNPQKGNNDWIRVLTSDCPVNVLTSTDSELLQELGGFLGLPRPSVSWRIRRGGSNVPRARSASSAERGLR